MASAPRGDVAPTTGQRLLLSTTIMVAGFNLRPAVSSIGPVLRDLQHDLVMGDTAAGVLTSLPVLSFGILGLLAGRIGRRTGIDQAMIAGLALLVVGLVARVVDSTVKHRRSSSP